MTRNPLFYIENISNPLDFPIDTGVTYGDTSFLIRPRTENGWTLDFVLNMNGQSGLTGNTIYYWGVIDEYEPMVYVNNNVSFGFTVDNKIRWRKSVYADFVGGNTTVIEESGVTPILCSGGTSSDFLVTIVFERNLTFDGDCDLENEGGENDLFTGWTLNNPLDVMSGLTPDQTTVLTLNEKWYKEKYKRLGKLKIYLNGRLIYSLKNWEEVIPTIRSTGSTIGQIWGGGTLGSGDIHEGVSAYLFKRIAYYEEPLNHMDIRDNYLTLSQIYDINECASGCDEVPIS